MKWDYNHVSVIQKMGLPPLVKKHACVHIMESKMESPSSLGNPKNWITNMPLSHLGNMQAFDIPHDKINVCGGAIAMGHPLGATGAMILGTVLDELERRDLNTALVTLCIGAGMGTATIIERV